MDILATGIKNVKNVTRYIFGEGSIENISSQLDELRRRAANKTVIFFIDEFFKTKKNITEKLSAKDFDAIFFVDTSCEPTTDSINNLMSLIKEKGLLSPACVVGMGGGKTLDTAKAISNLLTNGGRAEDFQGWDLVKKRGIYKIAIPTISGTGSEATRTCVITNKSTGLKLGMNSDYTVFDQIIMDPELTKSVPRDQYFYTGMDAFIHCFESKNGSFRNSIGDAFSQMCMTLCNDIFSSKTMMSNENRSKMMVASYFGGCAIATSYVGVVHPF